MPDERDLWWRVARGTVGGAFEATLRVTYAGLGHVPTEGAALLTYNHVSVLDPIPVALGAYRRGRIALFVGLAEVFDIPVLGWGLRRLRQVPLRRGEGDQRALGAAIEALLSGGLVAMAPEGRVGTGDELQRGPHWSGSRVALGQGARPGGGRVGNAAEMAPRRPRFGGPVRPEVAVVYGPPVVVGGDPSSPADVAAATARIMDALAGQVEVARSLAP